MKINIIAIAGQKHAGKTTLAREIKSRIEEEVNNEVSILNFASPLKQLLAFYKEDKSIGIAEDKEWFRKDMQNIGDAIRNYDKNFFTTSLINNIKYQIWLGTCRDSKHEDTLTFIIDDLRYINELEQLYYFCQDLHDKGSKVHFKVALLENPWTDYITDSHSSETEFDKLTGVCAKLFMGHTTEFPVNYYVHNRTKGDKDSEELIEMLAGTKTWTTI